MNNKNNNNGNPVIILDVHAAIHNNVFHEEKV